MSTTTTSSSWKTSSPHGHSHKHSVSSSSTSHQSHSHSRSSRPSTTPRAHHNTLSVGQPMPSLLSPTPRATNPLTSNPKTPSPSYFGFIVGDESIPPDSNPGPHTRQNWNFTNPTSSYVPNGSHVPVEANPEFEAFRRKSEQQRFTLNQTVSGLSQPQSRTNSTTSIPRSSVESVSESSQHAPVPPNNGSTQSFFDFPRHDSPAPMNPTMRSIADDRASRLSLPSVDMRSPAGNFSSPIARSETNPVGGDGGGESLTSPTNIVDLITDSSKSILLLDLRVYQQYAASRIRGALNLCIPTTLLKRPTFTVQKLSETFASEEDREEFEQWRERDYIIVYDSNSSLPKETLMSTNVLKKFKVEGWKGKGLIIKGGFAAFSATAPHHLDRGSVSSRRDAPNQVLSIAPPNQEVLAVAGGCSMPQTKTAANPFFGNIRQNQDLIDGVGQIAVKKPANLSGEKEKGLPKWLKQAAAESDQGKQVSDKFLYIEKSEQKRMQEALSGTVSYGTPSREAPRRIQIAGIEKGSKNRYNNIFPFDHTRVRLQNVPSSGCDYVNASFVQAEHSKRRYIATQAPIPSTFEDFWKVVWEQDVKVIVMLTAETEGGQVKSHPYWNPGQYGPLKLKNLSERTVSLDPKKPPPSATNTETSRPSAGSRRATTNYFAVEKSKAEPAKSGKTESHSATVRHLTISNSSQPFQNMREITQIQYGDWPDFGAPATPTVVLGLIDLVNKYVGRSGSTNSNPALEGQSPIIVHCSAGCGRTGTYCTIDSVIEMLRHQKLERQDSKKHGMEVDGGDDWLWRDDVDLVAKTVDDFRHQRLSMVQNLRQFVLCYESVLQWTVGQMPERTRPPLDGRKSYHG